MMDQRLSSGPRMPDSLNGEGALRKALDGPIDGRARKTSNTGDDGNTSSSQSLAIEGCNQVLLSLIEVRKQQGVLPLKFFGFAHSRIIPSPPSFVTLNFLRALTMRISVAALVLSVSGSNLYAQATAPSAIARYPGIRTQFNQTLSQGLTNEQRLELFRQRVAQGRYSGR